MPRRHGTRYRKKEASVPRRIRSKRNRENYIYARENNGNEGYKSSCIGHFIKRLYDHYRLRATAEDVEELNRSIVGKSKRYQPKLIGNQNGGKSLFKVDLNHRLKGVIIVYNKHAKSVCTVAAEDYDFRYIPK